MSPGLLRHVLPPEATTSLRRMDTAEFRKHGYRLIDWLADYWENIESMRILPDVKPGEIRSRMPLHAPERPEPFDAIMADLDEIVMPGIAHWQSPGWFAFFPANSSPPAVLGELAAAGLGVQGMMWATSPACTEVEAQVMDWMVDLMGLPQGWKTTGPGGGVIQGSSSEATHLALVIARHNQFPPGVRRRSGGLHLGPGALFGGERRPSGGSGPSATGGDGLRATTCPPRLFPRRSPPTGRVD